MHSTLGRVPAVGLVHGLVHGLVQFLRFEGDRGMLQLTLRPEQPMASASHTLNFSERATAMSRAERLDAIEIEIRARQPRAAARLHVSLSTPPARSAFQMLLRLSGDREDVLDFAAALYDEVRGMVRPDGTLPLAVQAIESESSEHIQLLLTRDLYEG